MWKMNCTSYKNNLFVLGCHYLSFTDWVMMLLLHSRQSRQDMREERDVVDDMQQRSLTGLEPECCDYMVNMLNPTRFPSVEL